MQTVRDNTCRNLVRVSSRSGRITGVCAFVLVVTAFFSERSFAQVEVKFNGYLEHQYSLSYYNSQWTQLDYDRLRGDINATAGRSSRLSAAVVWQLYRGDTRIRLRDQVPKDLHSYVDTLSVPIQDRQFVNHAFISLYPGPFEVTAGKQFMTWGAAWVFNPTELFRPKNVLEPTYEREGIGSVTVRLPLGPLSDVMVGYVPEGALPTSGKVVRARHHLGGFDLSAMAAVRHEPSISLSALLFPERTERRVTVGGDITGEVAGLGLWTEAAWSDHAGSRWLEATVGGNYTLPNATLLLIEGFYNGRGEWGTPYSAPLWVARLFGDVRSLGRVMVYTSASSPVGALQLWNVGLSGLVNAGDPSAVLIPSVSYAFGQNVDLLFNALIYVGREGAEFGGRRFGGFLRGRVYF